MIRQCMTEHNIINTVSHGEERVPAQFNITHTDTQFNIIHTDNHSF